VRTCKNKPHPTHLNKLHGTRWDESKGCHFERSHEEVACDGCVWQNTKEPKINIQRIEAGIIDERQVEYVPINFVEDRGIAIECPQCSGTGDAQLEDGSWLGICPRCGGTGEIGGWE